MRFSNRPLSADSALIALLAGLGTYTRGLGDPSGIDFVGSRPTRAFAPASLVHRGDRDDLLGGSQLRVAKHRCLSADDLLELAHTGMELLHHAPRAPRLGVLDQLVERGGGTTGDQVIDALFRAIGRGGQPDVVDERSMTTEEVGQSPQR